MISNDTNSYITPLTPITTSGTTVINLGQTAATFPAPAEPKRLSDREWLDAEVEEVCARAA